MTEATPKPKADFTIGELRDAFTADFGYVHALFDVDLATIEEAKERLEDGWFFFRGGCAQDGGRAGILLSLKAAIRYLTASLPASDLVLLAPLDELYRGLLDLELTGNQSAALTATKRGRSDSDAIVDIKAAPLLLPHTDGSQAVLAYGSRQASGSDHLQRRDCRHGNAIATTKRISSWRRDMRCGRKRAGDGAAIFRRKSLASRVDRILDEFEYKARVFGAV